MLTLRIWFFKVVTLKYNPCSNCIFSLLVSHIALMLTLRVWFFKVVTRKYILQPLSKAEHFSLIVLLLVSSSKPETGVSVGDRK